MMTEENSGTGFSEDYVKELRSENANWRIKVRDLESKLELNEVRSELLSKGVDVNPKWVELQEGISVKESVASFLESYPQFSPAPKEEELPAPKSAPRSAPKPMAGPKANTNAPGPKPTEGTFGGRNADEVKKDPKARAALRGMYRQLLSQGSNQNYEGE